MTKLAFAVLAAATLQAGAALANPMVGGAAMYETRNIVENAVNSADHTTLVAAVQAAGLVDTLASEGPFTVLAPTNAAFAALPAGTVESLLEPANLETLRTILTCHVVGANALSTDIRGLIEAGGGSASIETLGGCTFTATYADGMIMIEDGQGRNATVTIADVMQSNGVIHVIDSVLLPAS
ncbi:MAG: fasciclin domain-containing protein [Paracoccaceae bacterium]